MIIREYTEKDIFQMINIWNEVVEDGMAFPQEDFLDGSSGKEFFGEQSYSGVAELSITSMSSLAGAICLLADTGSPD